MNCLCLYNLCIKQGTKLCDKLCTKQCTKQCTKLCTKLCTKQGDSQVDEPSIEITRYKVHFPHHDPRKNSAIYNRTHAQMRHLPCFICGKIFEHVETHHFYIEKAAQNAIDWKVFGEFADGCYNIQTGEPLAQFDWSEVAQNPDTFVDSPLNMITLCKQHHTSGAYGIHHVPFPDWILQKFPKDGFQFLTDRGQTDKGQTDRGQTDKGQTDKERDRDQNESKKRKVKEVEL